MSTTTKRELITDVQASKIILSQGSNLQRLDKVIYGNDSIKSITSFKRPGKEGYFLHLVTHGFSLGGKRHKEHYSFLSDV